MKLNEFCEEFKDTCGETSPRECLEELVRGMSDGGGFTEDAQRVFQAVNKKYVALDDDSRLIKCPNSPSSPIPRVDTDPMSGDEDDWIRVNSGSPVQDIRVEIEEPYTEIESISNAMDDIPYLDSSEIMVDKDMQLNEEEELSDSIELTWPDDTVSKEEEISSEDSDSEEDDTSAQAEEDLSTADSDAEKDEDVVSGWFASKTKTSVPGDTGIGADKFLANVSDKWEEKKQLKGWSDAKESAEVAVDTDDDLFADDEYDILGAQALDEYEKSREKADELAKEVDDAYDGLHPDEVAVDTDDDLFADDEYNILAAQALDEYEKSREKANELAREVDEAYDELQASVKHPTDDEIDSMLQEMVDAEKATEEDFVISKEAMETLSAIDMANKDSLALLGLDPPLAGLTPADIGAAYELQLEQTAGDSAHRKLENAKRLLLKELEGLRKRRLLRFVKRDKLQAMWQAKRGPPLWPLDLKPGMQGFNQELAAYVQDNGLGFSGLRMSCETSKEAHAYQRVLANIMSQPSPAKRMLVNWATGTGKTGAMIAILDKYFDRPMNKLVIVPKNSIKDNFIEELLDTPNRYKQEFDKAMATDLQDNSAIGKKFQKLRSLYRNLRDREAEFQETFDKALANGVPEVEARQEYKARMKALAPERSSMLETFMKLGTLTRQLPAPLFIATYAQVGQKSERVAGYVSMFSRPGRYKRLDGVADDYRLDNTIILCDEAHNMVCPSDKLTDVGKELTKNAGARIAQSLRAVVGLFTATPIQHNILDYLRLMVIVKGPTAKEASDRDNYEGFDLNDRIPAAKDHALCDSRKVLSIASEKALYTKMVASWRQVDDRNEQGFVSSFYTRPMSVFARVRPNYTRLQGQQLTKKLIIPCVLRGRNLEHYIKFRFFPNEKMPVECLRSDDLAITDGQSVKNLHFTKVGGKYKMLPKPKKATKAEANNVQFVNQGVQALEDEEIAWLQDYETFQNVMEYGTEVDKNRLRNKLKAKAKLLDCSFPLHGDPGALLLPKKEGGCVSTLQKYENVAVTTSQAAVDTALSSKFAVLIEHLQAKPKKTVILLHRSNGFSMLEKMLAAAGIKTMVLPSRTASGHQVGFFRNTLYDTQGVVASATARAFFNAPDNCLGLTVEVALISAEDYSEGVSFQEVRQVILADLSDGINHVSWADIAQRIGRGIRMCSHKLGMSTCAADAQSRGLQELYPTVDVRVCLTELPTDAEAIRRVFPRMNAKCMALIVGQKTVEQQKWDGVILNKKKYDYFMDIIQSDSIETALETNTVEEYDSSEVDDDDDDPIDSSRVFVDDYLQQLIHKHQVERPATVPAQGASQTKPARKSAIRPLVSADVDPFQASIADPPLDRTDGPSIVPLVSADVDTFELSVADLPVNQTDVSPVVPVASVDMDINDPLIKGLDDMHIGDETVSQDETKDTVRLLVDRLKKDDPYEMFAIGRNDSLEEGQEKVEWLRQQVEQLPHNETRDRLLAKVEKSKRRVEMYIVEWHRLQQFFREFAEDLSGQEGKFLNEHNTRKKRRKMWNDLYSRYAPGLNKKAIDDLMLAYNHLSLTHPKKINNLDWTKLPSQIDSFQKHWIS